MSCLYVKLVARQIPLLPGVFFTQLNVVESDAPNIGVMSYNAHITLLGSPSFTFPQI